jgi:signal peptidase II
MGSAETDDRARRSGPDEAVSRPGLPVLFAVAALVVAADQLTKWWAVSELGGGRTIDLVGSLRFNLVYNRGSAFSIGSSLGPWIGLAAVVAVIALGVAGHRAPSTRIVATLGLVLGGALGNLSDRLFRDADGLLDGSVVDFIDLQWWPVFNVADMGIVVGGALLLLLSTRAEGSPAPSGE